MRIRLFIGGSQVDLESGASAVTPVRYTDSLDEFASFEFSEIGVCVPGTYSYGQDVALYLDDEAHPFFEGKIIQPSYDHDPNLGWVIGYTAMDLKYWANLIPVCSPNESCTYRFNINRSNDPDYIPSYAGLEIGQILKIVLDDHMTELNSVGIDGYVQADLDALTIVPPEAVNVGGPHLINALEMVLQQWQTRYVVRVVRDTVGGDMQIRFENPFSYTSRTLTFGVDPIDPGSFRCQPDPTGCYGRVEVRGYANAEAAILSVRDGTLLPTWDSGQQDAWRWDDFVNPRGMVSVGTVSSLTTADCVCDPDNPLESWTTDQWADSDAWIHLLYSAGNGSAGTTFSESRRINSNDSLTMGGTALVSWSGDIDVIGESYNKYKIVATDTPMSNVWRKYEIGNTYVKEHLLNKFPQPVPWANANMVQLVQYPAALIFWGAGENYGYSEYNLACGPMIFEIDRLNGMIKFREPTVKAFNPQADLEAGGASVEPPYDVRVIIPYALGNLSATYPADSGGMEVHSGTFYDQTSIQRTLVVTADGWIDKRQTAQYAELAQMIHETVKDVVYDGEVTYLGLYEHAIRHRMRISFARDETSDPETTSWESIQSPVREISIVWPQETNAPDFVTHIRFNNRKQLATGESVVVHAAFQSVQNAFNWAMSTRGFSAVAVGPEGMAFSSGWQGFSDPMQMMGSPAQFGAVDQAPGFGGMDESSVADLVGISPIWTGMLGASGVRGRSSVADNFVGPPTREQAAMAKMSPAEALRAGKSTPGAAEKLRSSTPKPGAAERLRSASSGDFARRINMATQVPGTLDPAAIRSDRAMSPAEKLSAMRMSTDPAPNRLLSDATVMHRDPEVGPPRWRPVGPAMGPPRPTPESRLPRSTLWQARPTPPSGPPIKTRPLPPLPGAPKIDSTPEQLGFATPGPSPEMLRRRDAQDLVASRQRDLVRPGPIPSYRTNPPTAQAPPPPRAQAASSGVPSRPNVTAPSTSPAGVSSRPSPPSDSAPSPTPPQSVTGTPVAGVLRPTSMPSPSVIPVITPGSIRSSIPQTGSSSILVQPGRSVAGFVPTSATMPSGIRRPRPIGDRFQGGSFA